MLLLPDYELSALMHFQSVADLSGVIPVDKITDYFIPAYMSLCKLGYINARDKLRPRLTSKALEEITSARYRHEQDAKRKTQEETKQLQADARADQQLHEQFKHDWRITIFGSVSSFVLGLVAQYLVDIVRIAARAWDSLFH